MFWVVKRTVHSFEYPQHMFWLRNKKSIFWYALLTKGLYPLLSEPGAYSYVWTEKCEQLLPKHYKARCLEYMLKDPAPVHYRPNPQKYTYDRYGTR